MPDIRIDIRQTVIDALHRIAPKYKKMVLRDDIRPIGSLGLVSADGVDFVLELEDSLGISIDDRLNPLVDDDKNRARTIGEICRFLEPMVASKEENS